MSKDENIGEDSMSLDEIFAQKNQDREVRLALTEEEWEVIILLAESDGLATVAGLRERSGLDPGQVSRAVDSLTRRGILVNGSKPPPLPSSPAEPAEDKAAQVAEYLESLQGLNHYQVLGLPADAGPAEIKRSYFKLMRERHPDRFMMEEDLQVRENLKEIFRVLTRAYETLASPASRREYDLTISDFTHVLDREEDSALDSMLDLEPQPDLPPDSNPNPQMAKSFFDSALEDFQRGDYKAAELNFKLAASMDPGNRECQESLDKTRRLNNKARAREAAIKAVYLEEEGKPAQALRSMKWAVEMDPEVPEYRCDLARILLENGTDLAGAKANVLLATDRHPGKLDYLLLLGRIQVQLGESGEARRTYKKILSLDPKNGEAKTFLEKMETP